jgi:hypothetical protein
MESIQRRKNDLIAGLAELYMSKEDIDKKIEAQKVAINELNEILDKISNVK